MILSWQLCWYKIPEAFVLNIKKFVIIIEHKVEAAPPSFPQKKAVESPNINKSATKFKAT
jgi:hypothetical protein